MQASKDSEILDPARLNRISLVAARAILSGRMHVNYLNPKNREKDIAEAKRLVAEAEQQTKA